jgi:hypothetical protein
MADVARIHAAARANGLVLGLQDWLKYLVKFGFMTDPGDYQLGTTTLTTLGSHFYQWLLANNHTLAELAASGRGT